MSKTRVITQYFPDILTLSHVFSQDLVELETAENYQKNSLRNRCYLASAAGKVMLSVPLLKGKHQQMNIREVRIAHHLPWAANHLRTIENNYRKAPFFDHFMGDIEQILTTKHTFLVDLNWDILHFLFNCFGHAPLVVCSLDYVSHVAPDPPQSVDQVVYPQLFENKTGFIPGLCILDMLFCIGPQLKYLNPIK